MTVNYSREAVVFEGKPVRLNIAVAGTAIKLGVESALEETGKSLPLIRVIFSALRERF